MRNFLPMSALVVAGSLTGVSLIFAQTDDPARVAEFQARFQQGYALEKEGKLAEARTIYDGILVDEPSAKRSLLEAGRISLELGEFAKADAYLDKLHTLVPTFPEAIELLIQTNQALKKDVKVERLLLEFKNLHNSGVVPEFTASLNFVREMNRRPDGTNLRITQFFDYHNDPHVAYIAEQLDSTGTIRRQIILAYNPDATIQIRAKDAKLASVEDFLLVENVIADGHVQKVVAYAQLLALPDYAKLRDMVAGILAGTAQPIYTASTPGTPP